MLTTLFQNTKEDLPIEMVSPQIPNEEAECESLLQKIQEICYARYSYNKQLIEFFLRGDENEIRDFCTITFKMEAADWQVTNFTELKKVFIHGTTLDAKHYQTALNLMKENLPVSALIDRLHHDFSVAHFKYCEFDNTFLTYHSKKAEHRQQSKKEDPVGKEDYSKKFHHILESHFFQELLEYLTPFITNAEKYLDKHYQISFITQGDQKLMCARQKEPGKNLVLDCFALLQTTLNLFKNNSITTREVSTFLSERELNQHSHKIINAKIALSQNLLQYTWEFHANLYGSYEYLQDLQTKLQAYVTAKKEDEENAPKLKATIPEKIQDLTQISQQPIQIEREAEKEACEKFNEERKSKTAAFFENVAKKKQEKEALKEKQRKEAEEKRSAQLLAQKTHEAKQKEELMITAFRLLSNLNKANLNLLEYLFAKPTPHYQIRYQQIESLFGQEKGKLQASLTSIKGSHRKLTIENVMGFFDEILSDPKAPPIQQTMVGPAFQVHHKGHTGKLPAIAIEMITSTLKRVGITKDNLELFRTAQDAISRTQQGPTVHWRTLLDIAKTTQKNTHSKSTSTV